MFITVHALVGFHLAKETNKLDVRRKPDKEMGRSTIFHLFNAGGESIITS